MRRTRRVRRENLRLAFVRENERILLIPARHARIFPQLRAQNIKAHEATLAKDLRPKLRRILIYMMRAALKWNRRAKNHNVTQCAEQRDKIARVGGIQMLGDFETLGDGKWLGIVGIVCRIVGILKRILRILKRILQRILNRIRRFI